MNLTEVKEFVYETLVRAFGEINIVKNEDGTVWAKKGSAIVEVGYSKHEEPLINIFSTVALNVPYSDKLVKEIGDINNMLDIGCLGYIEENGSVTILLKQSLIPKYTHKEELMDYFLIIAEIADALDDQIVNKFGGEKMNEFIERLIEEKKQGKKIVN